MPWYGTVTFDPRKYYNPTDFTRENYNVQYLQELLEAAGYYVALPHPINVAGMRNFPTVTTINNLRRNINALLSGVGISSQITVNPARKQTFGFNEANQIEKSLQLVFDGFALIKESWRRTGTFKAGEDGLL